MRRPGTWLPPLASDIAKVKQRRRTTYATGLPQLDELHGGGLVSESLTVLVGAPSSGKTSVALKISHHLATKSPIVYISTEFTGWELTCRAAAPLLERSYKSILHGEVPQRRVERALSGIAMRMVGYDKLKARESNAMERIRGAARGVADKYGKAPIVCVDFLQKLVRGNPDHVRMAVGDLADQLRELAQELGTPALAVSSTARANYRLPKDEPDNPLSYLAAAKESGDVEYAAANLWYFDRDRNQPQDDGSLPARIVVARCRYGTEGFAGIRFEGATGGITDDPEVLPLLSAESRKAASKRNQKTDDRERLLAAIKQREEEGQEPWQQSDARGAKPGGLSFTRVVAAWKGLINDGRCKLKPVDRVRSNGKKHTVWVIVPTKLNGGGKPLVRKAPARGKAKDAEVADERSE